MMNMLTTMPNLDKFFVGFDDQFNRMAKLHDDFTIFY